LPQDALQAEGTEEPQEPFAGEPLNVEVWYKGVDPFPEAVTPGRYTYYRADTSDRGRGVLVPVAAASVGNGTLGRAGSPPNYATVALDALLRDILASTAD
jgi:hypothetical protein